MHAFRSLIRTIVLALMVAAVNSLHAQDGLNDAISRLDLVRNLSSEIAGPAIATADFNHDTHPDGAILFRSNETFLIEVHFRFQPVCKITFLSQIPTLSISAFDVNNDGNPDLIVEEPFSGHRLFVWLNDGSGSFHPVDARNYPVESENCCRSQARPSESPQVLANVSGKQRIRLASPGSMWTAVSSHPAPVFLRRASPPAGFISTPNLLRGPPAGSFL